MVDRYTGYSIPLHIYHTYRIIKTRDDMTTFFFPEVIAGFEGQEGCRSVNVSAYV